MFGFDISTILLCFGIPLLLGYVGYKLAKRRNREAGLWAVLCFLFPILVIVLLCLGPLPPKTNQ